MPSDPLQRGAYQRALQIGLVQNKLKDELSPVGLKGLTWGTGVGTLLAGFAGTVCMYVGLIAPLIPGLGVGIVLAIFFTCIVTGFIMQHRARKKYLHTADTEKSLQLLEKMRLDILLIPEADRQRNGDEKNLRDIVRLQAQVSDKWAHKWTQAFTGFSDPLAQFYDMKDNGLTRRPVQSPGLVRQKLPPGASGTPHHPAPVRANRHADAQAIPKVPSVPAFTERQKRPHASAPATKLCAPIEMHVPGVQKDHRVKANVASTRPSRPHRLEKVPRVIHVQKRR